MKKLILGLIAALTMLTAAGPAAAQSDLDQFIANCRTDSAEPYCQCAAQKVGGLQPLQRGLVIDLVALLYQGRQYDAAAAQEFSRKYGMTPDQLQPELQAAVAKMSEIDAQCAPVSPTTPATTPPASTPMAPPQGDTMANFMEYCRGADATATEAYCQCARESLRASLSPEDQLLVTDFTRLYAETIKAGQKEFSEPQLIAVAMRYRLTVDQLRKRFEALGPILSSADAQCMTGGAPQTPAGPQQPQAPQIPPQTPMGAGSAQQALYDACISNPNVSTSPAFCQCSSQSLAQRLSEADQRLVADVVRLDSDVRKSGRTQPSPEEITAVAQRHGLTLEQFVQRLTTLQPTLDQSDQQCMAGGQGPAPGPVPGPAPAPGMNYGAEITRLCGDMGSAPGYCRCYGDDSVATLKPNELAVMVDFMQILIIQQRAGQAQPQATPEQLNQLAQKHGLTLQQLGVVLQRIGETSLESDKKCARVPN
ncbi:MAG: hypothetical protein HXY22_00205 [Alphaproteobacteria bacterium]|nr:hypothetical protein [Alphaproteobacteria bacterium]